jgi:hypothetical protein
MKKLVFLILCLSALSITSINAQKKPLHKATATPFQGVKEFCSFTKPTRFKVSITGNKIVITKTYNENSNTVTGIIKNGKIYTNDPLEKSYKFGGKYYLLSKTYLAVNNLEGGDYVTYDLCR